MFMSKLRRDSGEEVEHLSLRREILYLLKIQGGMTIPEMARELNVTREAVRIQIRTLSSMGWVSARDLTPSSGKRGRPATIFTLTPKGDNFFPKGYPELIRMIFLTIKEQDPKSLRVLLERMVEKQVQLWNPEVAKKKDLEGKLEVLKDIYQKNDPFVEIVRNGDALCLVEHNCPFLSIALEFPELCSLTISTLSHLLNYKVVRTKKFQNGDGCCEFTIQKDKLHDTTPLLISEK
jgi:predicted ArsR family transcriptional regulator